MLLVWVVVMRYPVRLDCLAVDLMRNAWHLVVVGLEMVFVDVRMASRGILSLSRVNPIALASVGPYNNRTICLFVSLIHIRVCVINCAVYK